MLTFTGSKFSYRSIYALCLLCIISACSSKHSKIPFQTSSKITHKESKTLNALYDQFTQWHGVPYRYGGTNKEGVDCSAFVQNTFIEQFALQLPRTTHYQSEFGFAVKPSALMAGDLVFFKTGFNTRHVGIYLDKGKFLHASTSLGVVVSSLRNPYWQNAYWQARRVLN